MSQPKKNLRQHRYELNQGEDVEDGKVKPSLYHLIDSATPHGRLSHVKTKAKQREKGNYLGKTNIKYGRKYAPEEAADDHRC